MKQSEKYQQLQMKEPSVLSEPDLWVWTSFIKTSAQKTALLNDQSYKWTNPIYPWRMVKSSKKRTLFS